MPDPMRVRSEPGGRARRRLWWLGAALLAALLASRLVAIQTVAVNWDEFALLANADRTVETGRLHRGGRPGLAVVALLPLVADCDHEIHVVQRGRLAWLVLTVAFLMGVGRIAALLQPDPSRRTGDALLTVALLAAVPAFLEWSIQVRTDQLALAAGAWATAALLASRDRIGLALVAGALLGLGFAATQKTLYVAALATLLAAGHAWLDGDFRLRRELTRAGLAGVAGLALVVGYEAAVFQAFAAAGSASAASAMLPVSHGLSVFEFYRNTIGFSQYRAMLPSLVPHGVLVGSLAAASLAARRGRIAAPRRLALAWAVLALGAVVAVFHAGAFFYFWMTLGMFPALALGVSRDALRDLLAPLARRRRRLLAAGFTAALAVPALLQLAWHFHDTQAVQRETLDLVHDNFQRSDAGFHPERATFCQAELDPFPAFFSQGIYRRFAGPDRELHTTRMLESFRDKPVKFMVHSWRLEQFPRELREFWVENYQPYRASLYVAGRSVSGRRGATQRFELVVPGNYRWMSNPPAGLVVDGGRVPAGGVIELHAGPHSARLEGDVESGLLALALSDPPGPASRPFYKAY